MVKMHNRITLNKTIINQKSQILNASRSWDKHCIDRSQDSWNQVIGYITLI